MNVLEAIQGRRAVRAFSSRGVDERTVKLLLGAAVQAPSAMNAQPWVFAVVQNAAQLKRYSDRSKAMLLAREGADAKVSRYAELLRNPQFDIFYDAATLLVVGVRARAPFAEADGWLAAANVMLEAYELGLGTCPIGFAIGVLNTPEVMAELGIPPAGAVIAPIIVGYPVEPTPSVPRNEPLVVSWSK
jgi:nitroreductase